MSFTPDLIQLKRAKSRGPLSAADLGRLKDATLEILSQVGVAFTCPAALDLFADHDAQVDRASGIVRIPADLVEQSLANAPRTFVLAGREERFDLRLDGSSIHICTEGVGTRVRDLETGLVRASCKDDVATMARVTDALPLVGFFWPPVSAQDHASSAPLHECHAALTSTLKHVRGGTTMHPVLASAVVQMAEVLAGSSTALRRRPPICANICTVAPLSLDPVGTEAALIYAAAGVPVSIMAMPTAGSTAPASLPGALVQGEAEVVAGLVLLQLAHPGCAVMHSNYVTMMDPRTGAYISDLPIHIDQIVAQLSHDAWGVPDLGGASLSGDPDEVDWVGGFKAGMGALLLPGDASDISGYLGGLTGGASVLHPELVILQHEALLSALAWDEELDVGQADLALDVIREVGPGGHFLAHRHTRERAHDFRLTLWQRTAGDTLEAARAEYIRIAAEHEPEPLPDDVFAELDAIVTAAEEQSSTV